MRIFITGGSGCIGHYIADSLIKNTNHELFFLVRNPSKLKFDYNYREGVNIIQGDLAQILDYTDLLKTINIAILAATCWGGETESYQINVESNLNLIKTLNPAICEQIIYFSTASILDQKNQLLPQAGEIGTDYIRTKYQCFTQLSTLELYDKIITVYPTLVFGGNDNNPYSHLSSGLKDLPKLMNLIRWFQADGSFHFIHGYDIATVITYLVENGNNLDKKFEQKLVLANQPLTVNEAIKQICNYLHKKIYFQIPLAIWLANIFIKLFNIQMAEWDYFCFNYRHFTYGKFVNPNTFNLESYAPNLSKLLEVSKVDNN
ncbi:MAG: NAD(P)-dependent oxidoreductase [Cyanobacteria bacterium]|nr:NAD(P)-dependent oxidoreductase [Cyanobacteria bacterium CG_2015-16_32_12]NCO77192.1 NAD(P)-dependent oxidoreductase [Cyanobacteria bacterium CG_2015-22_32_23]NCQ05627.1 NAD(P)-dependent oxidoreductase [Cyanobacteria bacterium CG_2015-09_32_10]NCQ42137.1 NAD(P)-dependent oxidoreductase [Cyanobacteria bacterium CG_2015-04_32_10]NCS84791.1 NAD(P)-dependent oxidoreductase [Cyanobacteria bacterium CG_2015-02_32_10]